MLRALYNVALEIRSNDIARAAAIGSLIGLGIGALIVLLLSGKPASTENNKPECHRCSDWSGCGSDCTLSRVYCEACGTSMAV